MAVKAAAPGLSSFWAFDYQWMSGGRPMHSRDTSASYVKIRHILYDGSPVRRNSFT